MTEITINNRDALLRDINDAMPLRKIADALDRMSLSADTKALLMDLAAVTVKAGEFVVNLGRKILTLALAVVQAFPGTIFGTVVAVVAGAMIAAVPLLGAVLAPLMSPLLMAFGLTMGALSDLRDPSWSQRLSDLEQKLVSLFA
jgi:hypothetical protein